MRSGFSPLAASQTARHGLRSRKGLPLREESDSRMIHSPYLAKPGKKVNLNKFPTDDTGHFKDKDDAQPAIDKHLKKLCKLQEMLYAQADHAVLIVLQAMDTGGQDGAIEHVFSSVNT